MPPFEGFGQVYAAGPCNEPNVVSIELMVRLTEGGDWSDLWFTAPPGKEREFLATAIAAITSNRKVLFGTRDAVNWGQLNSMYLTNTPNE